MAVFNLACDAPRPRLVEVAVSQVVAAELAVLACIVVVVVVVVVFCFVLVWRDVYVANTLSAWH